MIGTTTATLGKSIVIFLAWKRSKRISDPPTSDDIDKAMDQKAEKTERAMPPPVSTRVVPPPLFSPFSAFLIAVVIPLTLGAWVLAARACDSGVVFASQAALVTCMPTLLTAIVFPLWHSGSLAFISNWFVMSVFFNAAWQCPQLLLKDYFATAAASIASQPTADGNAYFPLMLFWWGYSTSDLDYASLSNFFVLAELSYWPISATAVVALYKLHRGRGRDRDLALILLLVCGSLQAYNVFFFISYGGTCLAHTFSNVAHGTLPTVVYFFMNLLWGVSGGTAAVVAGRELLGRRGAMDGARRGGVPAAQWGALLN